MTEITVCATEIDGVFFGAELLLQAKRVGATSAQRSAASGARRKIIGVSV